MTESATLQSCLGGWCALRDHCPHYHATTASHDPSERLCYPGEDGHSDVVAVRITRGCDWPATGRDEPFSVFARAA